MLNLTLTKMMSTMRFTSLAFSLLAATALSAQSSKLETLLTALEQDSDLKYASIGFCALDISDNKIIAQRNPNQALIPASTLKIVSTGTAVAILGRDYKFKTQLQYDGVLEKGVLKGNLYIKGFGDPSLGSPVMKGVPTMEELMASWAAVVQKAGISKIEGAVIGDGTHFERQGVIPTWQWGDVGNYYGAGAYGLNIHDNMYFITLQQTSQLGGKPKVQEVHPQIPDFKMENAIKSAASGTGDNAYIFAAPYSNEAFLSGTIPVGSGTFQIKGSIPNPPLFAAQQLQAALTALGIEVKKKADWQRSPGSERKVIHTHWSPSLFDISKHTNEDSRNLYCEALVRAIGLEKKSLATTEDGIIAILDFWRERGIETQGMFMMDGSGLSARNGISAKILAQIMRKMYVDKESFGNFYDQLAIAGQTGTLSNIGRGTAADGNVRAKSGSINRVRAYTGFVTTKAGKVLSFAVLVNNYSCSGSIMRKKLEQLMVAMAEM